MDQRANFLALILLDALEDENESDILNILDKNININPSYVPTERGISPLHYVCGMDNKILGEKFAKVFLEAGADPNVCTSENITPLHVASIHGREEIVRLLLRFNAKVDIYDDERKLPVHYAIEECHFEVVQLMKDHIFLNKFEKRRQKQQQFLLNGSKNLSSTNNSSFERSLQKPSTGEKKFSTPLEQIRNKNLSVARESDGKFTPNQTQYNYDVTSPYYINITHRRNKPQPKYPSPNGIDAQDITTITVESSPEPVTRPVNIFTLTKDNLEELSTLNQPQERSRISLIEVWREKVKRSNARRSILREFDNVNEMIQTVMENDHLNFTNTLLTEKSNSRKSKQDSTDDDSGAGLVYGTPLTSSNENFENQVPTKPQSNKNLSLGRLIQKVAQAQLANFEPELEPNATSKPTTSETETSYKTIPEIRVELHKKGDSSSNFIRSPNASDYYLQMTEAYVHTDDDNGLVFYETKLLTNEGNRAALQRCERAENKEVSPKANSTITNQSTDFSVPSDYETDALRKELTTFGEPPGPITKTTKRLYIKRLIRCKRKTTKELQLQRDKSKGNCENKIKFSVELYRSIRSVESFQRIMDYTKYDTKSMEYFANHQNKHKMREGHLKQSFIYMLIDPRVSCNLPGESIYMNKFDVWKRFLESVFYVGKGKTSRPYSHLYEAMKLHSRLHSAAVVQKNGKKITGRKHIDLEIFKAKPAQPESQAQHSKKLQRILDIWRGNLGVVCLHVFHNIMPIDAYTREAAIIDALGLMHLTNVKRGDYYGPAQTWTMKEKKYLGIALLFKAMKIYLAEGESQLSPSDLI